LAIDEAVPYFGCGFRMLTEKFCPKCGTAKPISYIDESLKVEESGRRAVVRSRRRHNLNRATLKLA
jgi:hypothetical protein